MLSSITKVIFIITTVTILAGCSWLVTHPKEIKTLEIELGEVLDTVIQGEPR